MNRQEISRDIYWKERLRLPTLMARKDRQAMSKSQTHPAELMTLREAGERCGLSPITLRVLIRNGRLNAIKRGRDWFITAADLDIYLASRDKRGGYRAKTGS